MELFLLAIDGRGEWSEEPPTCEHKDLESIFQYYMNCLTVYQH